MLTDPRLYHSLATYQRPPFTFRFEIAPPLFRDFSFSVRPLAPSRVQIELSPRIIPIFPIISGRTAVWSRNEQDESALVFLDRLLNPQVVDVDRRALAAQRNTDCVPYVKALLEEYKNGLSEEKKQEFETQVSDSDPTFFLTAARLCFEKTMRTSADELPPFFRNLRARFEQEQEALQGKSAEELERKRKDFYEGYPIKLTSDIDFIAILQKALEPLPSN